MICTQALPEELLKKAEFAGWIYTGKIHDYLTLKIDYKSFDFFFLKKNSSYPKKLAPQKWT